MPPPTNTELIRELTRDVATLKERYDVLDRESRRRDARLDQLADRQSQTAERLVAVEVQLADLKKAFEERSKQHWAVWVLLLGVRGNLLVSLIRK